jgi:SAM-dependent methyltransferase
MERTDFDFYVEDYDAQLNRGLSVSGEDRAFFSVGRIKWLAQCLARLQFPAARVLDFGCGTGLAARSFLEILGAQSVVGVDLSRDSLTVARRDHAGLPVKFKTINDYEPDGTIDLAFCNGVFHHVPLDERARAVQYVADCLRPGGLFAFWENNPWNPGTRYIMHKVPFDKDAIMVWPRTTARLVKAAGLKPVRIDYCFIFPKMLKPLRRLEPYVCRLPLGAQYQVLAKKP